MLSQQLRTLLWRNIVLKKRGIFSTLLEIIIPTLIITLIAKYSYKEKHDSVYEEINNIPPFVVNNSTRITNIDSRNYYYIVFSKDFNTQQKDLFVENFKKNMYFKSFKYLETNTNFTKRVDTDYDINFYGEIEKNRDINDYEKRALTNKTIEDDEIDNSNEDNSKNSNDYNKNAIQEYKIQICNDEKEFFNLYKNAIIDDNNNDDDHLYTLNRYAIIFKSISEYTLYFEFNSELIEILISDYSNILFLDEYTLQTLINNALFKTLMNSNTNINNIPDIEFKFKIMDKLGYEESIVSNSIETMVPFFMLFYFVPCICTLLNNLVIEKESKIKESLVIIGLKKSTFWISWIIIYSIIVIAASCLAVIVMEILNVFPLIHWTLLLFIIIIYGLSCICISFTISTFVNKSKTSNTIGAIIILFFFAFYFVASIFEKDTNSNSRWFFCVAFPQISFLLLFKYIINMESQRLSVSFLSLFDNSIFRKYIFAIIGSFLLYFLLAIYLDNVLPQGSNLYRKWHFFITDPIRHYFIDDKKKNMENNNKTYENENCDNPLIQKDPEGLKKSVEVCHIGKDFKVKGENIEILKNINFSSYYDEIFAILGHNGAGKTTLLRIMTGVLSASRGEVYYDDIPIQGNESEICKSFGYCPQFDTLNKNLTVGEHVTLFAGIKGIKVDVEKVLEDIDLLNKKDNFPKQLSGGQRRKLCITLALLGSPKFIFLDEPTTGLDPYSRKSIWELLSRKKIGCTMFVTTHYMDEADLLADRKMIISNGNITCLGSSLFLKNIFNMNYSLDINLTNKNDCCLIDPIIEYYCPGFSKTKTITSSHYNINDNNNNSNNNIDDDKNRNSLSAFDGNMNIVTYLLPMKCSNHFKNIFDSLTNLINNKSNSINNFSLTAPTLEELFIKLESNQNDPTSNDIHKTLEKVKNITTVDISNYRYEDSGTKIKEGENDNNNDNKFVSNLNPLFRKTNINKSSTIRQIGSLIKVRLKAFIRNKTFALIYTLFPFCLIIITIYLENKSIDSLYDGETEFKSLEIKSNLYNNKKWFKNSDISDGVALDIINRIDGNEIKLENLNYDKQLTIGSSQLANGQGDYLGGFAGIVNDRNNLEFTIYFNKKYSFGIPLGINLIYNAIFEQYKIDKNLMLSFNPLPFYDDAEYDENDKEKLLNIYPEEERIIFEPILSVAIAIAISLSISIYGPLTVKEREDGITWQLYLNGMSRLNYWIAVFISDTICLFVPILLIGLVGFISGISIFCSKAILYTLFITLLWVIGSLFHQYTVSHFFSRYDKCSNLFIIINPVLTLFISIYSLIIIFTTSIIDNILNDKGKNEEKKTNIEYILYSILILYVPSTIVIYYSKLSEFIGLRRLEITEDTLKSFIQSQKYNSILNNNGLSRVEKSKRMAKAYLSINTPSLLDILKSRNAQMCLIIAVVAIFIYVAILYAKNRAQMKLLKCNHKYTPQEQEIREKKLREGPKDVYNEFKRLQQSIDENGNGNGVIQRNNVPDDTVSLKVYRITKDFPITSSEVKKRKKISEQNINGNGDNDSSNKKNVFLEMDNRITYDENKKKYTNRIVDDVTFGVDNGQCLGLLGPNGAGKTTSISMMTGLLSRTYGRVIYGKNDLNNTDLSELSLGYCCQHDSLWNLLTVKETIQFYLNICGYPQKDISRYTKALIEACGIENHTNKRVSEISGGTKRKLSLIIAIGSSPNYLILDEPSAGMDPFTRRYMWKLISQLKEVRETATILTTHSTEEAEALCDRIAILIKGRLVCVDTPRSIKMNQSHRYILEVFTTSPEIFEETYVRRKNIFGLDSNDSKNYALESSFNYQKYTVEMKTENIANVFSLMEEAKENNLISQYNFGQYSLEQVFIDFVNHSQ